jgi:ribonuclease HI
VVHRVYIVYFDGLCEPCNPGGVATSGYVIYHDGLRVKCDAQIIGEGEGMTNNVAEYFGLMHAARWVSEHVPTDVEATEIGTKTTHKREKIVIRGDSQLVINKMSGTWKVKSMTSQRFVPLIWELLDGYDVTFEWIPRDENAEADLQSAEAYKHYCVEHGYDVIFMKRD